ncbi:MAG: UDP-N-acetylmuramoyl-L-alanine--D-glutamate ligase [Candidatus Eiseniibacteriota bacterium]
MMSGEGAPIAELRRNERGPVLSGATAVVLGYGRSGRAASALLVEAGATVRVTDDAPAERLAVGEGDVPGGTAWLGKSDPAVLRGADLVVASPGVPPSHAILKRALDSGVPVHSELELGWWFTDSPVVAITGTNGKTTTTELVGAMGRAAGRSTVIAGNVGTPLTAVCGERPELLVLEVSSFQLFLCEDFRPDVAALLNFSADHLDWHPDLEHYAAAKANIFARQGPLDAAVLPGDDAETLAAFTPKTPRVFEFRHETKPPRGCFLRDGRVTLHLGAELEPVVPLSEWSLPGRHNRENLMAAVLCARLIGLPDEAVREAARSFRGMPHRVEEVARIGGVVWVNDSKSTNPHSLEKALDPDQPTILIAGGVTKGVDFRPIRDVVRRGTRLVLLIGEGTDDMERAWSPPVRTVRAGDLENAVRLAHAEAKPGERVLLSPGCASFDQFANYADRGERFRRFVMALAGRQGPEGGEG